MQAHVLKELRRCVVGEGHHTRTKKLQFVANDAPQSQRQKEDGKKSVGNAKVLQTLGLICRDMEATVSEPRTSDERSHQNWGHNIYSPGHCMHMMAPSRINAGTWMRRSQTTNADGTEGS